MSGKSTGCPRCGSSGAYYGGSSRGCPKCGTEWETPTRQGKDSEPKPRWAEHWPEFIDQLEARLAEGHHQYGDWSFDKPHALLVVDLAEELLDIVGWGFILHCRLTQLAKEVDDLLEQAANQLKDTPSD